MDLTTLGLTDEQMVALTGHIATEVNTTKESYKDFMSKEDATKFTQSESDKLRTTYSKQIKEFEDKIKVLSPIVKSESELAMETRMLALEEKEKSVASKEKLMNTSDLLKAQGLPTELAKYLVKAENVETEITSLKLLFDSNKLDNTYVPNAHKNNNDSMTKAQFKALNYTDRTKLYSSNAELYNKLSQ
ncbi:MAG: hypothetical protein ACI8WT_001784 [Clostridium sp.]|jgi:hypothetical protein